MSAQFPLRLVAALLVLMAIPDAEAGRRGLRVDFGAWGAANAIQPYVGAVTDECPGAGVAASLVSPPLWQQGYVAFPPALIFQTTAFDGLNLDAFYCQHSNPYAPGLDTSEYLNELAFPEDERDLAYMIGPNTDNAVSGIRYAFMGTDSGGTYGRQWVFYFFPDDLTVVALYGVPDDGSTYLYESILDNSEPVDFLLWNSDRDGFSGQYFCFQAGEYIGDCVPPAPPPPPADPIFGDGFE